MLQHGRAIHLAPSTYERTLTFNVGLSGYPVGSVLPLGIAARLSGLDTIWAFQPYLPFQALLLALGLAAVLSGLVKSAWMQALVVFVAAQPALLYGYALWGSIKEVVTVPLIALLVAALVVTLRRDVGPRGVLVPAVAAAALLATLNVGGGVWIGLALLPARVLAGRLGRRGFAVRAGVFASAPTAPGTCSAGSTPSRRASFAPGCCRFVKEGPCRKGATPTSTA